MFQFHLGSPGYPVDEAKTRPFTMIQKKCTQLAHNHKTKVLPRRSHSFMTDSMNMCVQRLPTLRLTANVERTTMMYECSHLFRSGVHTLASDLR